MAIKRTADPVIGRPRFLGNWHLSSYVVYRGWTVSTVLVRGVRESFDDDFFADRYLHVYIELSGKSIDREEGHLSTLPHLHAKGGEGCPCQLILFVLLFFLFLSFAGVATPTKRL